MKKILWSCFCIATMTALTGCGGISYQTGQTSISTLNDVDKYTIGKTTLDEVQNELGGTNFIFEKDDGATKYVWQSENTEYGISPTAFIPIVGGITGASVQNSTHRKTLALTFDKNNVLSYKFFKSGDYLDPDIAKMTTQMMNQMYQK